MSITAVVEEGVIKLPKDTPWPPGTVVRIEAVEEQAPTLFEALKEFDGMAEDLPSDLASGSLSSPRPDILKMTRGLAAARAVGKPGNRKFDGTAFLNSLKK